MPRAVLTNYTLRFLEGLFGYARPVGEIVDVSELLIVEDLDEGHSGVLPIVFADF